jgi:hypothetical protein
MYDITRDRLENLGIYVVTRVRQEQPGVHEVTRDRRYSYNRWQEFGSKQA